MKNLLIIDDEELLLRMMSRVLSPTFNVVTCRGIVDALLLFDLGAAFDVILCDMNLNDGTGREFYAQLRKHSVAQSERIVFFSGYDESDEDTPFHRATRDRHLLKPIPTKALIARLTAMAEETPIEPVAA